MKRNFTKLVLAIVVHFPRKSEVVLLTACLVIDPFGCPAIYSDIVISQDGRDVGTRPIASIRTDSRNEQVFYHARKTYVLSDQIAAACAGSAEQAKHFIETIACMRQMAPTNDSCFLDRILAEAENYNDLSLVGARFEEGLASIFKKDLNTTHFAGSRCGNCAWPIGSGSNHLMAYIKEYDYNISEVH